LEDGLAKAGPFCFGPQDYEAVMSDAREKATS